MRGAPIENLAPAFARPNVKCLFIDDGHVVALTYLGQTIRGHAFVATNLEQPKVFRIDLGLLTALWNRGFVYVFGLERPWIGA